jgi:hypothetical protein
MENYFKNLVWESCKKESLEYPSLIHLALESDGALVICTADEWQDNYTNAQPLCIFKAGKEIKLWSFDQSLGLNAEPRGQIKEDAPIILGAKHVKDFLEVTLPKYHSTFEAEK